MGAHLAHKAEHAVELETGAIVAVTLHGADEGDTATIQEPAADAGERISSIVADADHDEVVKQVSAKGPREVVTDKGYHSRAVVSKMAEWVCARIAPASRLVAATDVGLALFECAGDWRTPLPVRSADPTTAAVLDSAPSGGTNIYMIGGGTRRVHLRGKENIFKRLVVHSGAANLGLLMRKLFGKGTPRALQGRLQATLSTANASPCLWSGPAGAVPRFHHWMAQQGPLK